MGAALIFPLVLVVIVAIVAVVMLAGRTSKARREEETLPAEPQERHDEEIRRLKKDHTESESPFSEV